MKKTYLYDYAECKRCKERFDKYIGLQEMHKHLMTHKDLELVTVAGAGSYFRLKNNSSYLWSRGDKLFFILFVSIIISGVIGTSYYNIVIEGPMLEKKEKEFRQAVINDDCITIHNMMQLEYNNGNTINSDDTEHYSEHLVFEKNQFYIKRCN
jgi:hypothetical protein